MTSFTLKIIAMISMFCDHVSYAIFGHFSILNLIGRIAFPIFAFQISEGFTHTRNIKKYLARLGVFALISQVPFSLFLHKFANSNSLSLNVFFTLFLGLLSICLFDYMIKLFEKNKISKANDIKSENSNKLKKENESYLGYIFGLIIVILIASVAELLHTDYGAWGVILVFAFYIFKDNRVLKITSFALLVILKYGKQIVQTNFNTISILLFIATLLPILFIDLYNGKQGKKIKYLLYWFYPIHLLALYLIF